MSGPARSLAAAILVLGLAGRPVAAQVLIVQRIDVEPTFFDLVRVRVVAGVFTRAGEVVAGIKPEDLALTAGKRALNKAVPGMARNVEPLDVAFVVQATQSFAEALPQLDEPMSALFKELGRLPGSRVAIVTYGGDEAQGKPFAPAAAAARSWSRRVVAEVGPAAPVLVDAVDQARKLFRGGETRRRLMVVIGDGRQALVEGMDREDLERGDKLPRALADDGIVVDAIAFDPSGRRGDYMRNLGQLSKLTNGFARLVTDAELLPGAVQRLQGEISGQLVLTYLVSRADVEGEPLGLSCKSVQCGVEKGDRPLESNTLRALPSCGGKSCKGACVEDRCVSLSAGGGAKFPWWIAGLGAGVVAAIGLALARRGRRRGPLRFLKG